MTLVIHPPGITLAELNAFAAQDEMGLDGELKSIGNKDGQTLFDIDNTVPGGKPAKPPVIVATANLPGGMLPVGAKTIGTGKVYVGNVLVDATAYRPA